MDAAGSLGQPPTMSRAPMAIELLTLGGFVLSAGFFTSALGDDPPPLDRKRWGCLVFSGMLLCVALLSRVPGWATLLGGLAFLSSVAVVGLGVHAARPGRKRHETTIEPAWWPRFEQDFAEIAHRVART